MNKRRFLSTAGGASLGLVFGPGLGDEAVLANQDYGSMIDMFKLQARRFGLINRFVDIPMDPKSDDEIVKVYAKPGTSCRCARFAIWLTRTACR